MTYDLVIKNGSVVDGSGNPQYRADVAVQDGKIAAIGRINDRAKQTIDAEGHVVSPGFVDGHTHMDAQVFWDPIGSCSCYHGVTSVVMGNCGFTLAPCKQEDADLVFRNLERAEDLSRDAMLEGIDWRWETFPQFLDVIDELPKGINYAGYIGHSALRTYVMGERAFSDAASEDDVRKMQHLVKEAVQAGAIGFSTSRTFNHLTADDRPVASRLAEWDEVRAIVNAVGETGKGLFEIAGEAPGRDPERIAEYHGRLRDLAVESGVPQTWGMFSVRAAPDLWRPYFDLLDETAAAGGRMYAQVHSRALSSLLSFESNTPFDNWEYWSEFRQLPLAEQAAKMRNPEIKAKLVEVASREYTGTTYRGRRSQATGMGFHLPHGRYGVRQALHGRAGPGQGRASGGTDDRYGAGARPEDVLPPAHRQRRPVSGTGYDEAPALGNNLLGLRCSRISDYGFVTANSPAQLLGSRKAGHDSGRGGEADHLQHRNHVGTTRPGLDPRRYGCRLGSVRP
jgi:N-acyl-D-aspartate/D-glutamate deacylase